MQYEACVLRPLYPSDLFTLLEWRNSDRVRDAMFSDEVIQLETHKKWFQNAIVGSNGMHFVFELRGEPVGYVNFSDIQPRHQRCNWGFYLGKANLEHGTGSAMGFLALSYLFEHTDIQKVTGEVLSNNAASLAFHKKLGFSFEGELKRHIQKQSKFWDVQVFAMFRQAWYRTRPALYSNIFTT